MAAEPEPRDLTLRDYLGLLRRRKITIALTALAVTGAALAFSFLQTPVYEATSEVIVRPLTPTSNQSGTDAQRAIDTEIKIIQSRAVEDAVRKKLGRVPDMSASAAGQTDVIAVTARSTNAKQAARDANAYARSYLEVRRRQSVDNFLSAGQQLQTKANDFQRQLDSLDRLAVTSGPNTKRPWSNTRPTAASSSARKGECWLARSTYE